MFKHHRILFSTLLAALVAGPVSSARAQGLVWKLPQEENVTIHYTGTYTQKDAPAAGGQEQKPIVWTRHLDVKVLTKAKGFHDGKEVDCRWIEFVVRTGEFDANRQPQPIDAGPAGQRMYRVLVPESAIIGKTKDAQTIFVSMLPIAKDADGKIQGVRKIGEGKSEWMKASVLQVYPIVTLLHHYRELKSATGGQSFEVEERRAPQTVYSKKTIPADQCKTMTASRVIEGDLRRITNDATFTRCDTLPTGLLSWDVKILHQEVRVVDEVKNGQKTGKKERKFDLVTEITGKMKVSQISIGDAQSQLPDPAK